MAFLLVGLGGLLGSLCRYGIGLFLKGYSWGKLPLDTFLVNITGSLLIGLILSLGRETLPPNLFLLLVPGFLGGFTTYSAFSGELFRLLESGEITSAITYGVATFLVGLLMTAAGFYLGKAIVPLSLIR